MGRDPPLVRGRPWSPGRMDAAETFAESDVTLTHTDTKVSGESIELGLEGSSISEEYTESGDSWGSDPNLGIVINPNYTIPDGVEVTVWGPEPTGTTRIKRDSDGTVLAEQTSVAGGDTVTLDASLSPDTRYIVEHDVSNRDAYTRIGSYPYPATSNDFDVVDGVIGTNTGSSYWYSIAGVSVVGGDTSGSTLIEWPMPNDLAGWDIIPYEATEDGGTVEVYAVDADGNEVAGPLQDPGDISSVSRSTNVRLRVDLSRPSTSENPRLEAIYRRYKV